MGGKRRDAGVEREHAFGRFARRSRVAINVLGARLEGRHFGHGTQNSRAKALNLRQASLCRFLPERNTGTFEFAQTIGRVEARAVFLVGLFCERYEL